MLKFPWNMKVAWKMAKWRSSRMVDGTRLIKFSFPGWKIRFSFEARERNAITAWPTQCANYLKLAARRGKARRIRLSPWICRTIGHTWIFIPLVIPRATVQTNLAVSWHRQKRHKSAISKWKVPPLERKKKKQKESNSNWAFCQKQTDTIINRVSPYKSTNKKRGEREWEREEWMGVELRGNV